MTINFTTIRGVDQWTATFPAQFEPLNPAQRKRLAEVLALGVHEGWKPTTAEVQDSADYITGKRPKRTPQEHLNYIRSLNSQE